MTRLIGGAYGFVALVILGTALAFQLAECVGFAGCIAEIVAVPARAPFWPVYLSFAVLPLQLAFGFFVLSAIALAVALLLAWRKYVWVSSVSQARNPAT